MTEYVSDKTTEQVSTCNLAAGKAFLQSDFWLVAAVQRSTERAAGHFSA